MGTAHGQRSCLERVQNHTLGNHRNSTPPAGASLDQHHSPDDAGGLLLRFGPVEENLQELARWIAFELGRCRRQLYALHGIPRKGELFACLLGELDGLQPLERDALSLS